MITSMNADTKIHPTTSNQEAVIDNFSWVHENKTIVLKILASSLYCFSAIYNS